MRRLQTFLLGLLLGLFLSVSAFEAIHRLVEIEGTPICVGIYDSLARRWNPDFLYRVKLVYKVFAWPVKTVFISISESQVAVQENGGNWRFAPQQ